MTTIIQRPTTADKVRPGDRIAVFGGEEMVVDRVENKSTHVHIYTTDDQMMRLKGNAKLYVYEYA